MGSVAETSSRSSPRSYDAWPGSCWACAAGGVASTDESTSSPELHAAASDAANAAAPSRRIVVVKRMLMLFSLFGRLRTHTGAAAAAGHIEAAPHHGASPSV